MTKTLQAPEVLPPHLSPHPGTDNATLVAPQRMQIRAPHPAAPAVPEWSEQRSRVMQERERNAAWKRRDLRESNPAAAHKERAGLVGREHSGRDLHRPDAREKREHPTKK
ncbi:MAG TPA: hypothetical protein VK524_08060 [Polyangiaceae bacterium]|nr:hypothetical protein [Polyangiaceae bacterium]